MRAQVTVTTTTVATIAPAAENNSGVTRNLSNVVVKNIGLNTVYLQWTQESTNLTITNGFPLGAGEGVGISRDWGGAPILGIAQGGNTKVAVSGD